MVNRFAAEIKLSTELKIKARLKAFLAITDDLSDIAFQKIIDGSI